jgi:RNA polymerase primary sigma factor/RNA polymerase sigma factor
VPRRLTQTFRCRPIEGLTAQLLFAPPDVRREQVRRAERLHDELDAAANYSLEFIKYRITGYRDADATDTVMTGEALLPDLRLLIDKVSASAPLPMNEDEAELPEAVAARLRVSTKTLDRWRRIGLRWRWVLPAAADGIGAPAGKPRIVFTRSAVEAFRSGNTEKVEKAGQFTQIPPEVEKRIIDRARRLVQARELSPYQVALHLSQRVGRAVETLRLLLDRHDREHPQQCIFIDRVEPLTAEQKREIIHARSLGTPVSVLAKRFRKTHTTIRRAMYEHRAAAIRRLDIRYLASPTFTRRDADVVILRPEPMQALEDTEPSPLPADDLPELVRPWFTRAPLKADDMRSLLIRMNYLRHRAAMKRDALDRYEPRVGDLDQIEADLKQAATIRDRLVMRCLPLVLSIARRQLITLPDRTQAAPVMMRLLEMGLPLAIDAIDEFDIRRNQSFDDYLRGLLMRLYATRTAMAEIHAASGGDKAEAKAKAKSRMTHHTGEEFVARLKELGLQQGVEMRQT